MNTFSLKLIACDKVFYDGPCEILIFDGFDGEMAIMANHEPMTCSVETGELRFRVPGETVWQEAIVSTGLLKVEHNKVDTFQSTLEGYGCGIWCDRANGMIFQYNEVCNGQNGKDGISRIDSLYGASYGTTSWC